MALGFINVVKDGVSPDSCTAELMAFLQRENVRSPKDAEGAPEAVLSFALQNEAAKVFWNKNISLG